jgi:hypothetical protein
VGNVKLGFMREYMKFVNLAKSASEDF